MDNEKNNVPDGAQETRRHDTVRLDAPAGDHAGRQGTFDMDKLRRDLEASKRLHDEARQQKRLAQARKSQSQAQDQFAAAQRAANTHKEQTSSQHAQPQAARTVKTAEEKRAADREARTMPAKAAKDAKKTAAAAVSAPVSEAAKAAPKEKASHKALAALAGAAKKHKEKNAGKARKPLHKRKGFGCLFYLLLFIVVICIAFGTLWAVRAHNAATPIDQIPESERAAVAMEREKSNVYLLLAGTDQRADEASRSDTIIYAALRPVDRKIEMVSIPRDSLVEIPGVGEDKINASLAYGGMDLLVDTVENLVDNPVDHTVLINFQSFAKIIDAMGGITIDVPEKMYLPEEGIDLEAGTQKLNGEDALAFVRWRGDGTGDIGRMQRQSQFMQALSEKVRHLTPWRAVMTLRAISSEIDTDMSTWDIVKLAWSFIGMSSDALEYQTFDYETPYINGISYVILNDQSVNEVIQKMKYGMVIDDGYGADSYDDSNYYY
ncbi:MAG: LCP family protein [Peptococcaceae bacterium]|nr:LCP family protein [Peptococcaceae bacterium]